VVWDGKLIAAGEFTEAGGVSANFIAAWDGSTWWPLGAGTGGYVNALTVYFGELIAGGWFLTAGGVTVRHIASWNGSEWDNLGAGVWGGDTPRVNALTVYDDRLIVGGQFAIAGGGAVGIACWFNGEWSALGEDHTSEVVALATYEGKLYEAPSLCAWDGESWSEPLEGCPVERYTLTRYGDKLAVAGAGHSQHSSVACWDGSVWQTTGNGPNNVTLALLPQEGRLIVGGCFTSAGNKPCAYLAVWNPCCVGSRGNVDGSADELVTMSDLTALIDHLFISLAPLDCVAEANVEVRQDGLVTMGDLTVLIDHLFVSLNPLPACP
jgi:hypothetical protein